ncbi:MAG: SDR family NAD(P)-dependent oxidoreductase, partial [Bacteroidota bacterium]
MSSKVILVTGANKGIGFEIVRQLSARGHHVLLAARDPEKGLSAVKQLQAEKLSASFVPLDITQDASIVEAVQQVKTHFDKIDVLMNNAAILLKKDQSLMNGDWSIIEQTIHADALAQLKVSRAFVPILSNGGKIIMTSSGGGSMTDPVGGWSPAYCISKSLLNAITRHLAYELEGRR